ncbi:MAG: Crp/Fnr family transcriptional regulator [Balneolales bacterium]
MAPKDFPELFINSLTRNSSMSIRGIEMFCSYFSELLIKNYFLEDGAVSEKKGYIKKGCTRSFIIDEEGKEHILFFGFEDSWLYDHESFRFGKSGVQNIQALEDTELLVINRSDWFSLRNEIPGLALWQTEKVEKMTAEIMRLLTEIKCTPPEDRYLKLFATHPAIFQRIALRHIASYLNIEPPSLSRIRRRIAKKNII